jgi:hypothetical protein
MGDVAEIRDNDQSREQVVRARIGAREDFYWVPTYELDLIGTEPSFVGCGWHSFSYHIPPTSAPRELFVMPQQDMEFVEHLLQKHPDD